MKRRIDIYARKVSVVDVGFTHRGLTYFMQESDDRVAAGRNTGLGTGCLAFMTERMPVTQSSITALRHRAWPGFELLPLTPAEHHFISVGSPGAGKRFLMVDIARQFGLVNTGEVQS